MLQTPAMFRRQPRSPLPEVTLTNDLHQTSKGFTQRVIGTYTELSFSYLILLLSSTLICTLGLLLNNSPVIIGGMIIAPLMWPLMNTALGISYGRQLLVKRGLVMVVLSTLLSLVTATAITTISPIKLIDTEITARTIPTLLDMFVALAAGTVATLAVTHPKVSESLAGVAIATSLLPPLCVSGIGLALRDSTIFTGATLLFLTNVASILFVSTLMFWVIGYKSRRGKAVRKNGLLFTGISLILLAIPLFQLLRTHSFEVDSYQVASQELRTALHEISPEISVDTIRTALSPDRSAVTVTAYVWLPNHTSIGFAEQQKISNVLEQSLGKKVNLNLRLQPTIAVTNETNEQYQLSRQHLENQLTGFLQKQDPELSIDSLSTLYQESGWQVAAVVKGSLATPIVEADMQELEHLLEDTVDEPVSVSLQVMPRYELPLQPTIESQVRDLSEYWLHQVASDSAEVTGVRLTASPPATAAAVPTQVTLSITTPTNLITNQDRLQLEHLLETELGQPFAVTLRLAEIIELSQ